MHFMNNESNDRQISAEFNQAILFSLQTLQRLPCSDSGVQADQGILSSLQKLQRLPCSDSGMCAHIKAFCSVYRSYNDCPVQTRECACISGHSVQSTEATTIALFRLGNVRAYQGILFSLQKLQRLPCSDSGMFAHIRAFCSVYRNYNDCPVQTRECTGWSGHSVQSTEATMISLFRLGNVWAYRGIFFCLQKLQRLPCSDRNVRTFCSIYRSYNDCAVQTRDCKADQGILSNLKKLQWFPWSDSGVCRLIKAFCSVFRSYNDCPAQTRDCKAD